MKLWDVLQLPGTSEFIICSIAFQSRNLSTSLRLCREIAGGGSHQASRTSKRSPITWKTAGITAVLASAFLGFMYYLQAEKDRIISKERKRQIGKVALGGKFELVDPEGKLVKSDDFLGKWVMIYFGFTHCPDVCPDELEKLALVVDKLGENFYLQYCTFDCSLRFVIK